MKKAFILSTYVSGKWNNSSTAGGFYVRVSYASSNRNRNISGHLVNACTM